MSDICLISADISDICRYLSDIGHIWNLGSFTKAILLQKCSISLIQCGKSKAAKYGAGDYDTYFALGTADNVCHITNTLLDPGKLTPGKIIELLCKIGFELRPIFGSRWGKWVWGPKIGSELRNLQTAGTQNCRNERNRSIPPQNFWIFWNRFTRKNFRARQS